MSVDDGRQPVELRQLAQALVAAPSERVVSRWPWAVPSRWSRDPTNAGITINEKSGLFMRLSSDDAVGRANELQHKVGEGPCLDVMRDQITLVSPDLTQSGTGCVGAARP